MRVAYLINHYPKVSHTFIRREILALERQGLDVIRIALRGWDDELADDEDRSERDLTRYVLKDGVVALLIAFITTLITAPRALFGTVILACQMSYQSERPLLIHLIYVAEACRIVAWLRKAKVEHLHAHFGTNSAEIAMMVHELGGPRWSFTVHGPEEFDKAPLIGLARKIREAMFVVAISSYGRSQLYRLVDHHHWPKIHVVHCGIERAFYTSINQTRPPATRRLVCVGRLCEQKGQLLLINAARQLAAKGAEFELVLAGDGEMRKEIDALILSQGLEDQIRITGWISSDRVREELLAARALVLPSLAEGLPVVLMEAMSLCRPVISTFVAGIPELVLPGVNGWLVPAGDVEALAFAMITCLEAPDEAIAALGSAGRQRVLERHNVDIEAAKLAELFNLNCTSTTSGYTQQ